MVPVFTGLPASRKIYYDICGSVVSVKESYHNIVPIYSSYNNMNRSDFSDDDSSSDDSPVPRKRLRTNTYGTCSTTSHGSHSDEDSPETQFTENYAADTQRPNKRLSYTENSPERVTRLSRSSLSENCSSPTEQYDDFRPGFKENVTEEESRAGYQSNENAFYNKPTDSYNESSTYNNEYSEISKRIMSNMGHKPGKGLGKFEHGRVEPVQASTQKGRRGLGLKPSVVGEVPRDFKWTPDESAPEAKEDLSWMPIPPEETLSGEVLEKWLEKGDKKLTIDDETDFIDSNILKGILNSKTIFDNLDAEDMRNARTRSNPYETIGSVIFLNRAAVKMANMDSVYDFMFTSPKKQDGTPAVDKKDLLYFADVCAGPGGFSEYVLFRRGWQAKGFGFTLKGSNDFKLSDFFAGAPETFHPYYGVNNDGNIFDPENLSSLKDHVLKQTDDIGVHFLMADGGFAIDDKNIQEILSKQLYLCQCLAALMLVRTGGHFVVKLFDIFTHFSVSLVYIMYRCFEKVSIFKPVTSRPANSERYLVCKWKKLGTDAAEKHLYYVNTILCNRTENDEDVTTMVPLSVIQEDRAFYEYIYNSNCIIGERQIKNLLKIAEFSKNRTLREESQAEMKALCLKLWKLPDKVRTKPERRNAEDVLTNIMRITENSKVTAHGSHGFKHNVLNKPPRYLESAADLPIIFPNVYDWHFTFLSSIKGSPDLRIFIGCGGKQVWQLDGNSWKSVADLHITLPANTLLYGEIAREYRGLGKKQLHTKALHVIDAMMLGGVDISLLSLTERINQCNLFCKALEKPGDLQALPIRCKRYFCLEGFSSAIANLEYREMKRTAKALTMDIPKRGDRHDMFYEVGSLMFIKEVKEPWMARISKTFGKKYYSCKGSASVYEIPSEAQLDMISGYSERIMWNWSSAIYDGHPSVGLSKIHMERHIQTQ